MTLCSEVLGTVTREAFEIKDVLEVGRWLQQKGFSDVIDSFEGEFDFPFFACVNSIFYRPRFTDQEMDGQAISASQAGTEMSYPSTGKE